MPTKTKKIIGGLILGISLLSLAGGLREEGRVHAQVILPNVPRTNVPLAPAPTSPTNIPPPVRAPTSTDAQAQQQINTIIEVLIIVEKAFLALSIPLNIVIGKLLSNDWVYLDGDAYKAIETIWILIRNIVNIVFACLLLVIAIAQIAGAVSGSESKTFALKQALPGFIFGLVFVNFSLLACKVILDVGNIATTAAFSIVNEVGPNLIAGGKDPNTERVLINKTFCWPSVKALKQIESTCKNQSGDQLAKCIDAWAQPGAPDDLKTCMGKKVYVAFGEEQVKAMRKKVSAESWTGPSDGKASDFAIGWSKDTPQSTAEILFDARNVMMVYTNSIFRMPEILTLYNQKTGTLLGTGTGILMSTLLTLIFGAMVILINVALVMALGIRMVLIWMILIFSPLMALEFVSDGKFVKGFLSKAKFDKGLLNGLVGLAFMPAIAGVILSLGFIIFHVLNKIIHRTTSLTPEGAQTFNIPPFSIEISGSIMPMFSTISEFIIACILLIILWQALFQMMQTNKYMDGAINMVDKLGRTIAGSAKMIPFIPMPGGGKDKEGNPTSKPELMSWAGLSRGKRELENWYSRQEDEHARGDAQDSWFGRFMGPREISSDEMRNIQTNEAPIKDKKATKENFLPALNVLVKQDGKFQTSAEANNLAPSLKGMINNYTQWNTEEKEAKLKIVDTWVKDPRTDANNRALRKLMYELHTRAEGTELKAALNHVGLRDTDPGNQTFAEARGASQTTSSSATPTTKPVLQITAKAENPTTPAGQPPTDYSVSGTIKADDKEQKYELLHIPKNQVQSLSQRWDEWSTVKDKPTNANYETHRNQLIAAMDLILNTRTIPLPSTPEAKIALAEKVVDATKPATPSPPPR